MWHAEFKAKDKKEAHAQLTSHQHVKVIPTNVLAGTHDAIDALEKPGKGQVIFVQTHGHSTGPSDWSAAVHASLMEEKAPS